MISSSSQPSSPAQPSSGAQPDAASTRPAVSLAAGTLSFGFTAAVADRFAAHPVPGGARTGRVVRVDRNRVLVAVAGGTDHLPNQRAVGVPATGDWVWLGDNGAGGSPPSWAFCRATPS